MSDLEPNDEGTVCAICRKPIVHNVDAIHGLYFGKEARHYRCTAVSKLESSRQEMAKGIKKLDKAFADLRAALKDR